MNFNNIYTIIGATLTLAICLLLGAVFGTPGSADSTSVSQAVVSCNK